MYVANMAAIYLSDRLHTTVHIGSIDIQFFKKVVLEDVYIEDQHHDTLLYSERMKLKFKKIDFKNHILNIDGLELLNTKYKLIKYKKDKDFNFQFIIDSFVSDTTHAATSTPWDIKFRDIELVNIDFTYRSEHDTLKTTGVNYFNLRTSLVNAQFSDVKIDKDTIFAKVNHLSAIEKSGFILQDFSCLAKVSSVGMQLNKLNIKTPNSIISTDLNFMYTSFKDFQDFNNRISFKAEFDHSKIDINDIAFFAPTLNGLHKKVILSGKITGKVNDIRGKKMNINIGGTTTQFIGDIKLKGLPNIDETAIYLNIEQLKTNYNDLKKIPLPPFLTPKTMDIPINIAKLGNMKFKGTFAGLYNDFYAYGNFSSAMGNLSSDLSVSHDEIKNKEFYKGSLKSKSFDFGKFMGIDLLGKVTADLVVDGSGLTFDEVAANLNGTIKSLDFKNYTYKNILVEGDVAKQIFKGKLKVKDDNVDFDFFGKVDFTQKIPNLDFVATINKADLGVLNFINTTKKTNLSTQLIVNVTGSNIDNLIGQVNFYNTVYQQDKEVFKLSLFNLESKQENGLKSIRLYSDLLDANFYGSFKILELPLSVKKLLVRYLPSYFGVRSYSKNIQDQKFNFSLLFKQTNAFTQLFAPKLSIAPKTLISGSFNSSSNELLLTGTSPQLKYSNLIFKNWRLNANANQDFVLNTGCERLFLADSTWMDGFDLFTTTNNDSLNSELVWDNKTVKKTSGDLKSIVLFRPNNIHLKILPSDIFFSDSIWSINKENEITWDSNKVTINKLVFEHNFQFIGVDGVISENKNDQIKLTLNNFNLANLNLYTTSFGFSFKGTVNGESKVSDIYNEPLFLSNNKFNSLYVNNNKIGDGSIESLWNGAKDGLYLHGTFTLGIVPNILFSGHYYPKNADENIDMDVSIQAIQMQIFQPLVKDFCSDFSGLISGNMSIKGTMKEPKISGLLNVNAKKVRVNYLNTVYNFSDKITISNNSFNFQDFFIYDVNHNKANVNGKVYHKNFKNFQLELELSPQKMMCLNTTEVDNNLYYGKAFVSGIIKVSGYIDDILIEAKVKTESLTATDKTDKFNMVSITKFYIPLTTSGEVNDNGFITFVKKDSVTKKNEYKVKLGGLKLDFDLEVTSDAEVQLIFDQRVGDIIKARGNGNIKLNIDTKGDFKMYGDYVLTSGDYLFTLKNLINKKFDIERGSVIKWTGIPYKADLNLSAIYKPSAILKPFFPDPITNTSLINLNKRYPIDLKLGMTGDLLSPDINFSIAIPTVDASTRQKVISYIDNDAEMNRQVFSLLILNSFVTPYQLANTGIEPVSSVGSIAGSAAGANTSELLSNQLSNMLRNISNDFDLGVNYRPGDAISKDELAVVLSTQLFNDKLSIDSNVGVNNNNQSANNIVGDVNVDYKLTDDGKARIKAFNKTNDITNQALSLGPYTQGVGAFYREEFNTIGELYLRYLNVIKKGKKKNTP